MLVKVTVAPNADAIDSTNSLWYVKCTEEQATVMANNNWLSVTPINDLDEMIPDWDICEEGIGAAFGAVAYIINELENA